MIQPSTTASYGLSSSNSFTLIVHIPLQEEREGGREEGREDSGVDINT